MKNADKPINGHLLNLYENIIGDVDEIDVEQILDEIEQLSLDYYSSDDEQELKIKTIIEKGFLDLIKIKFEGIKAVIKIKQTNVYCIECVGNEHYGLIGYLLGENQDEALRSLLYDVLRKLFIHENYKETFKLLKRLSDLSNENLTKELQVLEIKFNSCGLSRGDFRF